MTDPILYRHKGVWIGEAWYRPQYAQGADVVHFWHQLSPPDQGSSVTFPTLWIDLGRPEEALLSGMNQATRRHIRTAEKAGVSYDHFFPATRAVIDDFVEFYNAFARDKGVPEASAGGLYIHNDHNRLDLSRTTDSLGNVLVWHAHYRDEAFTRLRYSASLFRQMSAEAAKTIGSANRLHHWLDILRFRNAGIGTYDFGGWYDGTDDEARLRINQFKEGFGGIRTINYHYTRPITIKGSLYLKAIGLRERFAARSAE